MAVEKEDDSVEDRIVNEENNKMEEEQSIVVIDWEQ